MSFIKKPEEIEKMRRAGKILASVARTILDKVDVGITLKDLDDYARELIRRTGGQPAFLGYQPTGARKPYPCSICASVNDVVVHGIPTRYKLKSGDLLKLDFGVVYDGYYADAAWTIGVGELSPLAQKLIEVAQMSLELAIQNCRPGQTLGDIGYVISSYVKKHGFQPIKGLTGHGIGKNLHEAPNVENEGRKGSGLKLMPGMTLAIEPMISAGSPYVIQRKDDSFATADGSLSAHFEHTVVIKEDKPEVLTQLIN